MATVLENQPEVRTAPALVQPTHPLPAADVDHVLRHTEGLWEELRHGHLFITGGTGFFGLWLLETFAAANDRLNLEARATVLTRSPQTLAEKAPHLANRPDIELLAGDVRDFAFPEGEFTHVIHAAAPTATPVEPLEMYDALVGGTRRVLEFSATRGVRKLLFTSSGAVYGRQPETVTHVSETFSGAPDPTDPASAYGEGKRAAELACVLAARAHGFQAKIARCFAFVGPRLPLDSHFAAGNFIADALAGRPIQVNDGRPYRSYLYAADLAVWLWTILFKGEPGRPYNVGSNEDQSIATLAAAVNAAAGGESGVALPETLDDQSARIAYVPDVDRARQELGLEALVRLNDAISRTLAWHRGPVQEPEPPPPPPTHLPYAHLMAEWLVELGYTHCFFVAGGGCMHLIEGFRHHFKCTPVVHEMSAGIATEHFNECSSGGKAFALVTTGPGLTNIVTSIAGCYTDRRPLLVVAGQVKSTDLIFGRLRQRGAQEIDGTAITKPISVAAVCLREPLGRQDFKALVEATEKPHPGPVVIEVCLDVQGAKVERAELEARPSSKAASLLPEETIASREETLRYAEELGRVVSAAQRPLILIGGLVSRTRAWDLLEALERAGVPVATTTSALDRIPGDSPIYAGRPSSWGGQRWANLVLAQADVVVGIGVQWDLQQTGFNWKEYAPNAALYQIYPSQEELDKGHPTVAGSLAAEPDAILSALVPRLQWIDTQNWADYVRQVRSLVPVLEPANTWREGFVSSFHFLHDLSRAASANDILGFSSSGAPFTGGLQVFEIQRRQHVTTSPAFASMGYGLATAIGAALARPGQKVIHIEGDGGFAQNLQELATIRLHNLPIKMFLFDNGGYASIRATQRKFFGDGAYVGCDAQTGLGAPDWVRLFEAYGIPARYLEPDETSVENLARLIDGNDPVAYLVRTDPDQPNYPMVSTRLLENGQMISNPLYDQLPPLEEEVAAQVTRYLPK